MHHCQAVALMLSLWQVPLRAGLLPAMILTLATIWQDGWL
jgi:hypothetical protein